LYGGSEKTSLAVPAHERGKRGTFTGIAAEQTVIAENPQVIRPADGCCRGLGHLVSRIVLRGLLSAIDHEIDFCRRKTRDLEVEREINRRELSQLQPEHVGIPACVQGKLVVGEHICPLLGVRELIDADHRHIGKTEQLGSRNAAVACHDRCHRLRHGPAVAAQAREVEFVQQRGIERGELLV
jgi:hypothetical protein